jgi:F-type H+-transporting ATPase subunit epsilon
MALHFELVSPAKLLFSGDVDSVVIPGSEGEMTILPQHAPLLTSLRPGVVVVTSATGAQRMFVRGGFAEVNPKGLTLLAERAIPEAEMTDEDKVALAGGAMAH